VCAAAACHFIAIAMLVTWTGCRKTLVRAAAGDGDYGDMQALGTRIALVTSSDTQPGAVPATQALSADQAAADQDDLEVAIRGLSGIAIGGSLESSLTRIATFAVRAIPGADGVGLAMAEEARPATVVMSDQFVGRLDDIQYGLGEGPCIAAAAEGRTVVSGSLGADRAWPRFGPRAARLGVHSAMALPLQLDEEILGALNVYARRHDVFDQHAATLGEVFAVPAAVAVFNARTMKQTRRLADQLQTALSSRATIDQAIGILLSRQGGTAKEAFGTLRGISQRENVKLSVVAARVVEEAVRRARARHAGG
jgi:ANTAR domain/GAF domain